MVGPLGLLDNFSGRKPRPLALAIGTDGPLGRNRKRRTHYPMALQNPIIVCPSCHYGFRDPGRAGHEFICPRTECGHRWEAIGQTIRAVHGVERRRAVFELSVIAGASPLQIE